ncbi:MAG: biotin/lipoyl-binding protein, partial [Pseudomonadota bacterium]
MRETVPALVENLRLVVEPKSEALMQSIELEETSPPMVLTTLIGVICGLVASFLVWSALTKVEELTRSQGAVMPAGDVIALRHLEGGLVSEILVDEGEEVREGQPLLRLAPIDTAARLDQLKERQASVKFSIERHQALAENRAPNFESLLPGFADQKSEQFMLYTAQFDVNEK